MLLDLSLQKLLAGYRDNSIDPVEVIREAYHNIENHSQELNTLITVRDQAETLAYLKTLNKTLPLYGLPYVLKDSYATTELRTTSASKILDDYLSLYDATVHRKLKDAGAILIAKGNQDAWGHGASTENSDYGMGKNPWDPTRVVGGSSGGPAAAVITRMCAFAIGEDTGGSIRNPAAWNNISGLRVTYGRVSRYGCISYASSMDTVGPFAKSVEDLALVLSVIAGVDKYDATTSPKPVDDYLASLATSPVKLRIGIAPEMFADRLDSEIATNTKDFADKLASLGHELVDISLPVAKMSLATYYILAPSETSSNLGRYDGIRYGGTRALFTQESMRRIMMGSYELSSGYYDAYYRKALKIRTLLLQTFQDAFSKCDVILLPENPVMPPLLGDLIGDPLANMLADLYNTPVSLVGSPSLVIPSGFHKNGLPIGVQLVGPKFSESLLLALGHQYQQNTAWHTRSPQL
ncbi:Asp-tRNA(Asn)/Glu-tRNA(Gln) amidotransferase subunit GatA [Candidatus Collierbacteria bacterium CG10_big_fil_rev_8_21_14_0_10_44_9]|uniref:Glutamyl-tRNA(Gln) amidotransferase subunit A n=1 Tax=Candidatus Collierbacteria bacterium CG10_big_fil_rev_8_21_14_0_10_44_9 TaxID=1974535 RepID=A0A2H0VLW9_9BACT|nr:MAG: Asp-tRNA(Asn)/Glu-tRNA(Gln) amidotransferase subunit GatA [Candidatus Collierbacteria bacterium CG10_big_fil_rev_8_21_14_0_10_44_9]